MSIKIPVAFFPESEKFILLKLFLEMECEWGFQVFSPCGNFYYYGFKILFYFPSPIYLAGNLKGINWPHSCEPKYGVSMMSPLSVFHPYTDTIGAHSLCLISSLKIRLNRLFNQHCLFSFDLRLIWVAFSYKILELSCQLLQKTSAVFCTKIVCIASDNVEKANMSAIFIMS